MLPTLLIPNKAYVVQRAGFHLLCCFSPHKYRKTPSTEARVCGTSSLRVFIKKEPTGNIEWCLERYGTQKFNKIKKKHLPWPRRSFGLQGFEGRGVGEVVTRCTLPDSPSVAPGHRRLRARTAVRMTPTSIRLGSQVFRKPAQLSCGSGRK